MTKTFFPEHLHKDWMLHFSGFLTWSIIAFLSLKPLPLGAEFILKALAYIAFYISFSINISSKSSKNINRSKVIIVCQTAIVLTLVRFDQYDVNAILLVLIATQLPAILSKNHSVLLMFLISIMHFMIDFNGSFTDSFFHVAIYFMLQIFGFSAIESALRESKAKEDLAVINQELLATRFMLKESSQRKERMRISRDLHDAIGHQLTALSLNLEVSCHKVSDEFKPMLQENLTQAKSLLTNVREVVKEMRNEEQFDLAATLKNLVAQLPNCQLNVEEVAVINSLSLKQQLFFCLQEGISNALRHGKATELNLHVKRVDNNIKVTLTDNGSASDDIVFGNGLTGMQERLSDFQGKVTLLSQISGCSLQIDVEDCYD
ncbi:sensor histidine kinase [Colwelliaceae bacterium 6441]